MKIQIVLLSILISITPLFSMETFHDLSIGFNNDLGIYMGVRFDQFSTTSPIYFEGRGGYIYQKDPGDATEARKIFINDNGGGQIEKFGESYNISLEVGYTWMEGDNFSLDFSASGLLDFYSANFAYIGDNEVFAVKTSAYGLGAGVALKVPITKTENFFVIKTGIEYYFKSSIEAHGTYIYTTDGKDDNPRNDYTYDDADSVINQPEMNIYVLLGVIYRIGV